MQTFTLTAEHVKLLRASNVGWNTCEFGAACIDCKRPYGNGSVFKDMAKILGIVAFEDAWGETHFSKEQVALMEDLHKQTETALQIVLAAGSFEPGKYVAGDYSSDWRRAE